MAHQWTIKRGQKEHGPVSSAQLRKMAIDGKLKPTDLVRCGDTDEWREASSVAGLFSVNLEAKPESASVDPFTTTDMDEEDQEFEHFLDLLLPVARQLMPEGIFRTINAGIVTIGRFAQWGALFAFLAYNIALGVKVDSIRVILLGLMTSLGLLILQYWSQRTASAIEVSISSTPVRIASTAIVDGCAVTCLIAGICLPVGILVFGLQQNEEIVPLLISAVLALIALTYLASLALHPALLNVRIDKAASAGEEAVGIVSLVLRSIFRLVPIIYSLGMVIMSLAFVVATIYLFKGGSDSAKGVFIGMSQQQLLFVIAAIPVYGYLLFLFYSLFIDIFRAVLVLPSKLDDLREQNAHSSEVSREGNEA